MRKSILFVDDERNILKSLNKAFENTDYEVIFAEGGEEAIEILGQRPVNLIITDVKMPNMDGFELLQKVKRSYPLVLRVALSGYSDNKRVFDALDNNLVKIYMLKPWNSKDLLATIDRLFHLEETFEDKKLLQLINELSELPTVPSLYSTLVHLVEKDAPIEQIANVIEEDQSIASRILKVANSAFYAAKTGSVHQAIMYIGLTNVKNIILTNAVFSNFMADKAKMDMVWRHVNVTNKLINEIYKLCLDKKMPNTFASSGLLHDIGKVVIMHHLGDRYDEITMALEENSEIQLSDEEKRILGVDHQKVGGYLLNWWGIPLPIVEASMYHHDPLDSNIMNTELVGVVHIANHYAYEIVKKEGDKQSAKLNEGIFEKLGIDKCFVENIVENFDLMSMDGMEL
jgi:HD-like signal output (HDOD) protein